MHFSFGFSCAAVAALAVVGFGAAAQAIPVANSVSWSAAANLSGDGDVSNTGTTFVAYDGGDLSSASPVINGVTFAPFMANNTSSVTHGSVTVSETTGAPIVSGGGGTNAGFSTAYNTMLTDSLTVGALESMDIHFTGLTLGQSYLVQLWSFGDFTGHTVVEGGPNLDTPDGQFATGTFTAVATTLDVLLDGDPNNQGQLGSFPKVNGFQVRAVPEPASAAALSLLALAAGRRRRR